MVAVKFDPTTSSTVADTAIHAALVASGARSRDEDDLLACDVGRAAGRRWDVTLELITLEKAEELEAECRRLGLGRVRLVGATWGNPWVVSDRLMLRRRRYRESQSRPKPQLGAAVA